MRIRRLHRFAALVAAALTLAAAAAQQGSAVAASPCGRTKPPPIRYQHVIWIWMENQRYENVIGSQYAPYLSSLAAGCGLATSYYGVAHPSLPNYIAATSGGTWGIGDDAAPAAHPLSVPNIFSVLQQSGRTWRSYQEDAPGNCSQDSSGNFAVKHDPASYYVNVRAACKRWDVPLGTTRTGNLASALRRNHLPSFAFVTPNVCHDMHSCGVSTGDAWIKPWIAAIAGSKAYRAGKTAIFVVWDETDTGSAANHVPLIVIAPPVRHGTRVTQSLDHYSLLKTTLQLLGIKRAPGEAGAATTAMFATAFRLLR